MKRINILRFINWTFGRKCTPDNSIEMIAGWTIIVWCIMWTHCDNFMLFMQNALCPITQDTWRKYVHSIEIFVISSDLLHFCNSWRKMRKLCVQLNFCYFCIKNVYDHARKFGRETMWTTKLVNQIKSAISI